jgi:flagella basal body P-ring formation protein FlgA
MRAACVVIFGLLFFSAASFAADSIQLTLKEKIVIDQDVVRLADIASISGVPKAVKTPIEKIVVAKSPLPGQTRHLSLDYIRIRLKQAGFETDAMNFQGPQDVQISRQAATVRQDTIIQAVEAAIRKQMPWRRETVIIRNIHFDDDIKLPTGTLTHRIIPNRNEDYLGRTMLALHLYVDGERVKKTWAHANICVMADVVNVVRPLGKHQRIERGDLALMRADLSDLPSNTIRNIEEALGNRTTQMIYPNTVLKTGMFRPPPLVKRGDIVKIVANAGPMTITATGKVKQKGARGDMVHVINTDSNRVIAARVIGPGTVEVDF